MLSECTSFWPVHFLQALLSTQMLDQLQLVSIDHEDHKPLITL